METLTIKQKLNKSNNISVEPENMAAVKSFVDSNVAVVILLDKSANFKGTLAPYDIDICGKKMWEWVALSCLNAQVRTCYASEESDIISLVKPYLTNKKYTMILHGDTPLFSSAMFMQIMNYVRSKQPNVLPLERGYVFDTNYLKGANKILNVTPIKFKGRSFFKVVNGEALYEVKKVIKNEILNFHIKNGVVLDNKTTISIDSDVVIESGTVIYTNNTILGKCYIGKNCQLYPNNTIINSILEDNCIVKNSYVENSSVKKNVIVGPFEKVIDKE